MYSSVIVVTLYVYFFVESTCLPAELHLCTSSRLLYLSIVLLSGGLRIVCHISASIHAAAAGMCQHLPRIWLSCAHVVHRRTTPQRFMCSVVIGVLCWVSWASVCAVASSMHASHGFGSIMFVNTASGIPRHIAVVVWPACQVSLPVTLYTDSCQSMSCSAMVVSLWKACLRSSGWIARVFCGGVVRCMSSGVGQVHPSASF